MTYNPSTVAREALRKLAESRLVPTPENYTRTFFAIAEPTKPLSALAPEHMLRALADALRKRAEFSRDAATLDQAIATADWDAAQATLLAVTTRNVAVTEESGAWAGLLRDLITQWDARIPGVTQARKREALDHQLNAFKGSSSALYPRLKSLLRSWRESSDTAAAVADANLLPPPIAPVPTQTAREAGAALPVGTPRDEEAKALLRELLAQTLQFGIVERLGYSPQLAIEAQALAAAVREAETTQAIGAVASRLKKFWIALEIRGEDQRGIQQGLLRLLHLVAGNIGELAEEESWLRGQMKAVETLVAQPVDSRAIAELERALHEVAFKQGTLKPSLDAAKLALKSLLATFVDRLGLLADDTGGFHDRMERLAEEIARADDIGKLSGFVGEVMRETRGIQSSVEHSREELAMAREQVGRHQARVRELEGEIALLSDRLHEDALTQVLNRRGLDRSFDVEAARADRRGEPLCLAILDVDNFKQVNDKFGHHAGDLALVHLASVIRQVIRPFDVISRYGGEEFVLLLPHTDQEQATTILTRVQRELTKRFFMHNNERVLITFSAGVAARGPNEAEDMLLERADKALYRAKQSGKNRVETA